MTICYRLVAKHLVVIGCMLLSCGVLADGYGQGSDATVEWEAPPASAADPATIDLRVVLDTLYAAARAGQASFDPCLADTLVMDLRTLPQAVLPPQVDLLGSGCVLDIRPAYYAYLPGAERGIGEAFFKVPRPPRRAHWVVEGLRIRQPVPSADTTVVRCNPTRIKDGGSWSRLARCMGLRQTWDIARSWDPVTRRGSTVRFEDYRCVGPGCNGPLRGSSARSDTLRRFHVETYGSVVYSASCGGGSQIKDSVYAYVEDSTIRGVEPPEWSEARAYAARPQRHLMYASSCVGFDMHDVTFGPMPYADLHREAWGSRALMRTHGSQTRPATVEQHFWRTTVVGPGLVLNSPVQTTHWHEPRFTSLPGERRVTFNIPGDAYVEGGSGERVHFTFKAWGARDRPRTAEITDFECTDCRFEFEATGGPPTFVLRGVRLKESGFSLNQASGRVEIHDSRLTSRRALFGARQTPERPVLLSGTTVESQTHVFGGHMADFAVRLTEGARVIAREQLVARPKRVTVTVHLEPGTRVCQPAEFEATPDGCAVVAPSVEGVRFVSGETGR